VNNAKTISEWEMNDHINKMREEDQKIIKASRFNTEKYEALMKKLNKIKSENENYLEEIKNLEFEIEVLQKQSQP
jgi:GTP-binding protein EngB required for normal cell division